MKNREHLRDELISKEYIPARNHPRMPRTKRAAQFAPFAALTGFEQEVALIREKYQRKRYLDQTAQTQIWTLLTQSMTEHRPLTIEYFNEAVGYYDEVTGVVTNLDNRRQECILANKQVMYLENIGGAWFRQKSRETSAKNTRLV